jgi:hypothetical protein
MKNQAAGFAPALCKESAVLPFGIAATACVAYCLAIYIILQKELVPGLAELPPALFTASLVVPFALLAAGLFHIFLLTKLLKRITGRFLNSLFILLVVASGVFLFSDITFLSDIGKEYSLFDVTNEWAMLYGFTAFHLFVIITGVALLQKRPAQAEGKNEAAYFTVHHIALISGLLGIAGVFLAMSGALVPLRYATGFMVTLAVLALIPLLFILIYWRLRFLKERKKIAMDEKQVADTAFAGLVALLAALPFYIVICTLDLLKALYMPVSFFILLLFFAQLIVFSSVVLAKNK